MTNPYDIDWEGEISTIRAMARQYMTIANIAQHYRVPLHNFRHACKEWNIFNSAFPAHKRRRTHGEMLLSEERGREGPRRKRG